MIRISDTARTERLYCRALKIAAGGTPGLWLLIMQHLAFRGHIGAMRELANWYSRSNRVEALGAAGDHSSAAGLYRRAWRRGDAYAAQHLAMSCFNRGDLQGYRRWIGRAAQAGDTDARREARRFETRLPHANARKIGRLRPFARRDQVG
ncbi:MAG: hypothetical protein V4564_00775 [Pseudomonadota bacterium]